MLYTLLIFVAVLAILVLTHELGHFIVARKAGMAVEEFGFGFPPRLWAYKGKDGTLYTINLIPLGGFVRIKGESGANTRDHDSFAAKSGWWRLAVLLAGVGMNLLTAAVLLSFGFMIGLPTVIDELTPPGGTVLDRSTRVMSVAEDSPASRAGIVSGDELLAVDGEVPLDAEAARLAIGRSGLDGVTLRLRHQDGTEYEVTPKSELLPKLNVKAVGIGLVTTGSVAYPVHLAIVRGVVATGESVVQVTAAFTGLIAGLFTGAPGMELSGPVGIAVMSGEAARMGIIYLLQFTALLSVNLAVVNVLPLPALDGGRILFLAIETVRRKRNDEHVELIVHNIGFLVLMGLVVLVTYHDIAKLLF